MNKGMTEQKHVNTVKITVTEYDRLRKLDEAKNTHKLLRSAFYYYDAPKLELVTFDEALEEVVKHNQTLGEDLSKLEYKYKELEKDKKDLERKLSNWTSSSSTYVDLGHMSLWKLIKIKLGWV
jgi:chromosome segregation ATPase